jgi:Polysaccharide biosynthesis enzyme WcbI
MRLEASEANLSEKPGVARRRRRRVIGFIGNCQAELLQRAFQRIVPDQTGSFYHFWEMSELECERARADLDLCDDLLIQDIQNCDDYPLRDTIRADTRVIRFPFLWFAAPWPYDDFNGLRDIAPVVRMILRCTRRPIMMAFSDGCAVRCRPASAAGRDPSSSSY